MSTEATLPPVLAPEVAGMEMVARRVRGVVPVRSSQMWRCFSAESLLVTMRDLRTESLVPAVAT